MKLKVDISKLTESPYSPETKSAFHFGDDERMKSISLELLNAPPSCFLISGYRGVGKTSFVNRVIENVKSNTVCASLNLAKYDGYPRLVKKLIRELFINFHQVDNDLIKSDEKLFDDFKLLYDRTFHEVSSSQKDTVKKEWSLTTTMEADLKEMIMPLILFIVSLSNLFSGFISIKVVNFGAAILTFIWLAVKVFKLVVTITRSKTNVDEQVRRSLYDDEIAEHHLINILKRLNAQGIKILISLDEIDKMQDVSGAIKTLEDLKPLLLSGYANFFIVAGQSLFYEYERSAQKENEAISTLFSRIEHISFLKNATLKSYCLGLLTQPELKTDVLVNEYFDSLILASSRIPRKLVNLIRSKLIWKEAKPHLNPDETQRELFTYESRLLASLTNLMDNKLLPISRNDVQLDFFIAQIFLWVARMRETDGIPFLMSVIINADSYNFVPQSYIAQLWGLGDLLTDELIGRKFIKVHGSDYDTEQENFYIWLAIPREDVNITNIVDDAPSVDQPEPNPADEVDPASESTGVLNANHAFVVDFIELESLIRKIWDEIGLQTGNNQVKSLAQIIDDLVQHEILGQSWYNSSKFSEIMEIRKQLVHGTIPQEDGKNRIQAAQFNLRRLHAEIIESYFFYVCHNTLNKYEVTNDNRGGFDFLAYQTSLTLAFDVKTFQNGVIHLDVKSLLEKFNVFKETTEHNCYYIIICFQSNEYKDPTFYNTFNEILHQQYPELSQSVEVIYLLENTQLGIGPGLAEALIEIKNGIEEDSNTSITFYTTEEQEDAERIIKEESHKSWPNDFEMQLRHEKNQKKALDILSKLKPPDFIDNEFSIIVNKAKKEWPKDFEKQLSIFEGQNEALKKLDKLKKESPKVPEFDVIFSRALSHWPEDYIMQLQEIQNQMNALSKFNDFGASDVDNTIIDKLRSKVRNEWPDDYEMQLSSLEKQIASYREVNN